MDRGKGTNKNANGPKEKGKRRRITEQFHRSNRSRICSSILRPKRWRNFLNVFTGQMTTHPQSHEIRSQRSQNSSNRGHRRNGDLWSSSSTNSFRVGNHRSACRICETRGIWNNTYNNVESGIASQLAMRPVKEKPTFRPSQPPACKASMHNTVASTSCYTATHSLAPG